MPKRIQRKRTKGWRMPDGAVYVGRPGKWGNPFAIGGHVNHVSGFYVHDHRRVWRVNLTTVEEARQVAVELYALHTGPFGNYEMNSDGVREELAGRDLACWCPLDQPCHADVLLELANAKVVS